MSILSHPDFIKCIAKRDKDIMHTKDMQHLLSSSAIALVEELKPMGLPHDLDKLILSYIPPEYNFLSEGIKNATQTEWFELKGEISDSYELTLGEHEFQITNVNDRVHLETDRLVNCTCHPENLFECVCEQDSLGIMFNNLPFTFENIVLAVSLFNKIIWYRSSEGLGDYLLGNGPSVFAVQEQSQEIKTFFDLENPDSVLTDEDISKSLKLTAIYTEAKILGTSRDCVVSYDIFDEDI